jgi:hypothetical protein
MKNKIDINEIERIVSSISEGSNTLLRQTKYSADYLFNQNSEIAEANIVVHIASAFIRENKNAVWAEVPFRRTKKKGTSRFDLSVALDSPPWDHSQKKVRVSSEHSKSLKIEAKRIGKREKRAKLEEIIDDFHRIRTWRGRPSRTNPFHPLRKFERFLGAILVLVPEGVDEQGKPRSGSFSKWWSIDLESFPKGYKETQLQTVRNILKSAKARGYLRSPSWDGKRRLTVLFALFDFGAGPATQEEVLDASEPYALLVNYEIERKRVRRNCFILKGTFADRDGAESAKASIDIEAMKKELDLKPGEDIVNVSVEISTDPEERTARKKPTLGVRTVEGSYAST